MSQIKQETLVEGDLQVKAKRLKKPKKPKEPKDLRSMFLKHLSTLDIEKLKFPWMAEKSFRLIHTTEALKVWVDKVLADESRFYPVFPSSTEERLPVIAVDTETIGLDTRILVDMEEVWDPQTKQKIWTAIYEVKIEIAGVCLSPDGIEGVYIPINHEDGKNIDRDGCRELLQFLFDRSHLVFYNAKFDREVLRLCLGIQMRPYPYFEDVQVIQYINDPKADFGDKDNKKKLWMGDAGGLKALSKNLLNLEQIELETLCKVKADFFNPEKQKVTLRVQYAPFTWVPTDVALWYAASDALCTWLLWERGKDLARSRKLIHRIDHELVDTLTWVERQRYLIDVARRERTAKWHKKQVERLEAGLRELAQADGWVEPTNDAGEVLKKFNPNSNGQGGDLPKLLFEIKKLKVVKKTDGGGPSCDAEALLDLLKLYPDDKFLKALDQYKDYVSLHPENLRFDRKDNSARIFLKQNVVGGGRLSGAGGDFERDGGFGLNPQGIKRVEGNWWVRGNVLDPDEIPEDQITPHDVNDLHPSCFKPLDIKDVTKKHGNECTPGSQKFRDIAEAEGYVQRKEKWFQRAPGIVHNHIGQYLGYAICLVPSCTECEHKHGILIPKTRMDANQVVNLRALFVAPEGWTFFVTDYSNIEMRAAANVSGEPEFIKEFLEGAGDFHSLTASKVFPEFNDPNTPKDVRKEYRSLAKIINFALLYGGTEYTIFENMKKKNPDITWERAKKMVADYWVGVPVFAAWCHRIQAIAREHMTCTTKTGRVVNFESAFAALKLHRPLDGEKEMMYKYRDLKKRAERAKVAGDKEGYKACNAAADRLWKDPETGVRNAIDYNKYFGKMQRIAVNLPLQGLAGDFMRIALNRIRIWANRMEPLVQAVLRLHGSVHDEIDYSVKNEYAPFVVPRVTRMMKLRKYHEHMGWVVPIECDTEFGTSWDVEHHLTGDDGHKPAAWTELKGMENYLPPDWDMDSVDALVRAITSGVEAKVEKARAFLAANIHPRANSVVGYAFHEDPKKKTPVPDAAYCKKHLIAAIQLHEFWTIDHTPDGQDETLETLEQFEARCGLDPAKRPALTMGYLDAVPQEKARRPKLQVLGEAHNPEDVEVVVGENAMTATVASTTETAVASDLLFPDNGGCVEPIDERGLCDEETNCGICEEERSERGVTKMVEDDEVFGDFPTKSVRVPTKREEAAVALPPKKTLSSPARTELRDNLTVGDFKRLNGLLKTGQEVIVFWYRGKQLIVRNVGLKQIPAEFLKEAVTVAL